jgi:NAD(P)-dependent dehydrogenase (short-subunit alcohol dehydrogenase family)
VQDVISRIQQEWGGLDILVNNVGGSNAPNGGYKVLSDDDWQKALNVHLLASVRLDRAFLPGMDRLARLVTKERKESYRARGRLELAVGTGDLVPLLSQR